MNEELGESLASYALAVKNAWDELLNTIAKRQVKPQSPKSFDDLRQKVREDLHPLLDFEQGQEAYIIKPERYLGTENVAIANIYRSLGGE